MLDSISVSVILLFEQDPCPLNYIAELFWLSAVYEDITNMYTLSLQWNHLWLLPMCYTKGMQPLDICIKIIILFKTGYI